MDEKVHQGNRALMKPKKSEPGSINPAMGIKRQRTFQYKSPIPRSDSDGPICQQLFLGDLVTRLARKIEERRVESAKSYGYKKRFSWANLARTLNMSYDTIQSYFSRGGKAQRRISLEMADKFLWACNLSILDLLEPNEILEHLVKRIQDKDLRETHGTRRTQFTNYLKMVLDKELQRAHNPKQAITLDTTSVPPIPDIPHNQIGKKRRKRRAKTLAAKPVDSD